MNAIDTPLTGGLLNVRCTARCVRGASAWWLLALGLTLMAVLPARAAADVTHLSLEQLMEIPVVGASKYPQKQREVAAAVSVITREDIRTFGWRTLTEALDSLPSVYSTYDRVYTYQGIRGLSSVDNFNARILVSINGNRINEPTTDSAALGNEFPLDLDLIERIEYIPGPGGAVYGQNALIGVVNVITRDGAGIDGAELAAALQDPQRLRQGRVSVGRRFDSGLDVAVSASGLRAGGENRFYDFSEQGLGETAAGVATDMDGERDQEFFARIAKGPWSFQLIHGNRRKDDPLTAMLTTPLVPNQFVRDAYLISQVQYQGPLTDDSLQLLARAFVTRLRYEQQIFYSEWYSSTFKTSVRGGELRLLSTALPAHKLMLGLELLDNQADYWDLGWRVGLYAQDEWRLSDTLASTLGLRVDRSSVNGTAFSPRAALIWQATPASTLKLMAGRAHRPPNVSERDWVFSEIEGEAPTMLPAADNEIVDTLELVADHRVAPDLSVRGSLYQWSLKNEIVRDELGRFVSGPRIKATGLELSADKTWGWGGRLRASLSHQKARYAHGEGLINSPQWQGKLHFSTPLPAAGLRLGYEWQLESARLASERLQGHGLSNLHLTAERLAPGVSVSLGIYNLFNKVYQRPAYVYGFLHGLQQDGRSVRLKMEVRF